MASMPSKPAAMATTLMVALHAALWGPLFIAIWRLVPRFQEVFANYQMKVPSSTEVAIDLADWLSSFLFLFPPVFLCLLVFDASVLFLLWRQGRTRILGWIWFIGGIVLALAAWAGLVISLWTPYVKLTEGLNQ